MNDSRKNIFLTLSRALVLVPYTVFFAVQVFFNYDIAQPVTCDFQCKAGYKNDIGHIDIYPSLADKSKEKKSHFRLNKRFQPVGILFYNQTCIVPVVHYVRSISIGDYVDPLTPSYHFSASTLRGPPAIA